MKKWGFIFLQRPFIYLLHAPNFLPSLSGSLSVAISPVRTHKDAPSLGTERVPTARLLSLLPFIRALVPHPPVTAETSRIHQRQQALHLAAAATVWTPWLDLSHTLQNATLITKSPPRVWASKTFWQDLIYAHHQLEEALPSVTLPSRPTLSTCSSCISSCALDSFAAPVGPVAVNWMYVLMGLCKSGEIGSAGPECAILIQDEHEFKLISRPTPVNTGLISTEGRLQRWN